MSEMSSQRTKDKEGIADKISQQAAFVEHNPAPVIRTDCDGVIELVNPATTQAFEKELKGESVFSIFTNLEKNSFNVRDWNNHFQFEEYIGDKYYLFSLRKNSSSHSIYFLGCVCP